MSAADQSDGRVTIPGYVTADRFVIIVVFPLVGLLIGVGVQPLAEWAAEVDDLPFGRFSGLVATFDPWWAKAALAGVGLLAGAAFAIWAMLETVRVTVEPDRIGLWRCDKTSSYDRVDIDSVFVEAKRLVLLDRRTAELAREPFEGDRKLLAEALARFGYAWSDGDPYSTSYRRWIDGARELADSEHLVLRRRAEALGDDDKDEAAELRGELARIGLVVRDEGHRQYWRRTR